MLVLLLLLISRLINRSGLRISHSKVFSSGGPETGELETGETELQKNSITNKKQYKIKTEESKKTVKENRQEKQRMDIVRENKRIFNEKKPLICQLKIKTCKGSQNWICSCYKAVYQNGSDYCRNLPIPILELSKDQSFFSEITLIGQDTQFLLCLS